MCPKKDGQERGFYGATGESRPMVMDDLAQALIVEETKPQALVSSMAAGLAEF